MLQSEFEQLTGKRVSPEEYAKIEKVYMAAPDSWDKAKFCKAVKGIKDETNDLLIAVTECLTNQNDRLMIKKQNAEHDAEMALEAAKETQGAYEAAVNTNKEIIAERDEAIAQKVDLAKVLLEKGFDKQAIEILGHPYVISLKCSIDMELSKADKAFLANYFGK